MSTVGALIGASAARTGRVEPRYHDRRVGVDPASARLADSADSTAPGVLGWGHGALERIAPAGFEAAESAGGARR